MTEIDALYEYLLRILFREFNVLVYLRTYKGNDSWTNNIVVG